MSAGKETTDEKQAQHFGQSQNVTGVVAAPILGPYERNQLSIAVNATHQHGDPHSPPETRSDCPLQTRSKLRITCAAPGVRLGGRFPPPWTAEVTPNCFIVRDADGQQLAYVYF